MRFFLEGMQVHSYPPIFMPGDSLPEDRAPGLKDCMCGSRLWSIAPMRAVAVECSHSLREFPTMIVSTTHIKLH